MQWLAISLVLSITLTIALNVIVRLFPGASERADASFASATRPHIGEEPKNKTTLRVLVPWKAMLVVSVLLTLALNLALWIR